MERYDSYKDSGVDWLGQIPSHWSTLRAKFVFREIDDRSVSGDEELLSVSHLTGVTPRSEKNITMFMAEDYTGAKLCHEGDLVINTMWAWMGALGVSPLTGIVSPAYGVYRQHRDRLLPKFADWLFRTPDYVAEYTRRSTGVNSSRLRLYPDQFLDLSVLIPPPEDQERIVAFLDQKTAEIDAAIAKKERLIELLQEQKSILINQAVTRGLNADVPLRDSGVEWLPQVPSGWRLKKLKFLARTKTGDQDTVDQVENGQYPFYVRSQTIERINKYTFDGEAVLTAGDGAGVGKVYHYVNGKFGYHQRVYKISNFREVIGRFFFFYMVANFHKEVMKISAKSTVDSLRLPMFLEFPVAYPVADEQKEIVEFLEIVESKIDAAITVARGNCEQLEELKRSLIASAVTGKIKV